MAVAVPVARRRAVLATVAGLVLVRFATTPAAVSAQVRTLDSIETLVADSDVVLVARLTDDVRPGRHGPGTSAKLADSGVCGSGAVIRDQECSGGRAAERRERSHRP